MVSNRMASFPHHLLEGYRTFTSQRLPTEQSRYRELSERGQAPEVMVIGCCDSRVSPEVIFDAGPGELFVVRNVANLVPFIGRWMSMFIKQGEKVEQRDRETMQDFTVRIEKAAVFRSLENLMTFPFVRTLVERGELSLHGAYFGVAEGSLFVLDPAAKEFRSVREIQTSS